jgi:hypothetical protein
VEIVNNLDELNDNNHENNNVHNPPTNFQGNDNKQKGENNDKYKKLYDEV